MTHPRYWDALAVAIVIVVLAVVVQAAVSSIRTRPDDHRKHRTPPT